MNTVRYARWMQERGFRVILFCVNGSRIQHNAVSHRLKTISVRRNGKYFDLLNAWRVHRLFRLHEVNLCWFRDTRDFSLLGWVKRFSLGRLRLLYHQAMQFGVSKKDLFHTLRFRAVDAWVSTLEFLAQQVRSQTHFPHSRLHVVPLGVDDERLFSYGSNREGSRRHYGLDRNDLVLGIIGRLDPLKGQHTAIEALAFLHRTGKRPHLLIVGESTLNETNYYEQSLHMMAGELEIAEYVHFFPYTKKVELFYEAIDIFLMCSKGETFGTVTIEAMAFTKPVIGTDSSGTPEILEGECGLLFSPGDAEELAGRINLLISDPDLRNRIAANGRNKFNLKYSKKASVDHMVKIILQLAQENP